MENTYRWGYYTTAPSVPEIQNNHDCLQKQKPPSALREEGIHNKCHLRWEAKIKCHDVPYSQKRYLISFNYVISFHPDDIVDKRQVFFYMWRTHVMASWSL